MFKKLFSKKKTKSLSNFILISTFIFTTTATAFALEQTGTSGNVPKINPLPAQSKLVKVPVTMFGKTTIKKEVYNNAKPAKGYFANETEFLDFLKKIGKKCSIKINFNKNIICILGQDKNDPNRLSKESIVIKDGRFNFSAKSTKIGYKKSSFYKLNFYTADKAMVFNNITVTIPYYPGQYLPNEKAFRPGLDDMPTLITVTMAQLITLDKRRLDKRIIQAYGL
jgi:hypothetical protein